MPERTILTGGAVGVTGVLLGSIQSWVEALSSGAVAAGIVTLAGAAITVYGMVKAKRRDESKKDAESSLEIEKLRLQAETVHGALLATQVSDLKRQLAESLHDRQELRDKLDRVLTELPRTICRHPRGDGSARCDDDDLDGPAFAPTSI